MAIEEYRNNPGFGPGIVIDHAQHAIAKYRDPAKSPDCSGLGRVRLGKGRVPYYLRDPFLRELPLAEDVLKWRERTMGWLSQP